MHAYTKTNVPSNQLKREAENLQSDVRESERRIRQESEKVTRQLNQDVRDLVTILDDQDHICADLQATLKHQHRHIQDLQSSFENMSHNYGHALSSMSSLEMKANKLCHEIDAVRRSSRSLNS